MKIKILKETSIYGVPARAGDVVDATQADASYLMQRGKAVLFVEPAKPVVIEPSIVEAPAKRKPRTKVTTNGTLPANS
jgi:hypothetical protein